LLLDQMGF